MATTAGLYALSWTSGLATATRISGTTANDRAPVLSTRGTTARVAFARTGGSGGIFLATRGSSWGAAAQQSTSGTGDALPALVTDAGNHVHLAYDRN
jgi:hypothetical protein